MRAIVLRMMALFGAIALSCGAWVLARYSLPPAEYALIAPLLPQQDGQSVCLTGSFTSQVMDIEDWSKAKMEPTKHLSPDGKPYMRPVPPVMKDIAVRSFTLRLVYDTRTSDYDWIYNFRLAAEVEGVGTMFAAGEAPGTRKTRCGAGTSGRSAATPRICSATSIATAVASTSTVRAQHLRS